MGFFRTQTKAYRDMKKKGFLLDFETWPQSGLTQWPPRMDYPVVYVVTMPTAVRHVISTGNISVIFTIWVLMPGGWTHRPRPSQLQRERLRSTYIHGLLSQCPQCVPTHDGGGVYDHQRATTRDKRVFILTRSYFAGQQRYGANTWAAISALHGRVFVNKYLSASTIPSPPTLT